MQEMQPRRLHPLLADAKTTESFCWFFFSAGESRE